MSDTGTPQSGINTWLEEELYQQYLYDQKSVDESWKQQFAGAVAHIAADHPGQSD